MKTTTNHGLKKPDGTDTVNIEDLNYNSDVLDGLLTPATITTNGFMSKEDKVKLNGVATGANNYTHPATHPVSMISGLHAVATSGSYNDLLNKPSAFPPSTHTHTKSQITDFPTSLPANGGNADTVDGSHAWELQTLSTSGISHGSGQWIAKLQYNVDNDNYFKFICGDGSISVKVENANLVKGRDLSAELDGLKSTVVNGKTSVANAINGKLGTSLSNQTPFDDMAYYISNGLISSPTSATCGSFTLTFGNNFTTKSSYIVRSAYKIYSYSLYGVAVTYQVYKKPSGSSLSLLYSGTISTASPTYTQLTDGDNTAVYFIFFGASGVTLHATNANGSGNATFDYCI